MQIRCHLYVKPDASIAHAMGFPMAEIKCRMKTVEADFLFREEIHG